LENFKSCAHLGSQQNPRGDFIGAAIGHNPSYVWRSIWSSRMLLAEGHQWKIGNGHLVSIWNDPWLRRMENPQVQTAAPTQSQYMLVSQTINYTDGSWKPGMRI